MSQIDDAQGKDNAEGRTPPNSRRQEDDNQREDMDDGRICVGPCDGEMTDPKDVQGEAELKTRRRRFDGWRVALFGAFIVTIGGSYDGGVPPIPEALLGGSQDAYADGGGSLLSYLIFAALLPALAWPLAGWAVDRWGSRRMVVCGLVALSGGLVLYLGADVPGVLPVVIAVLGIGGTMGFGLPMVVAVNHWFHRRRARAMAVMLLPSVVAAFLIAVFELGKGSLVAGVLVAAAVLLALCWPVLRLVKNRPEDHGQHPDGVEPGQPVGAGPLVPDYGWREALTSRVFWLVIVGGSGWSIAAVSRFYNAFLVVDHGFAVIHAGGMLAMTGLVSILVLWVAGWLGDRLPIRFVIFGFALVGGTAVFIQAFADNLALLYLSAAVAGVGIGGAAVLNFAVLGVYFGRRNFGTIVGVFLLVTTIVSGAAPVLFGVMKSGTEEWTFLILGVALLSAVAALAYLFLGTPRPSRSQLLTAAILKR